MTAPSDIHAAIDQLFRTESGRLCAVLTRIFGSDNMELAEDVVQDSFIEAVESWKKKGLPENPSAWLFKVARNKALNVLNRDKYKKQYSKEVAHLLQSEWTAEPVLNHLFSAPEILDDQLRMLFTCCHPSISPDSQIALALKTLCGFSIPEIARAFLTTEENINKRLVRARQKIREEHIPFEVPSGTALEKRLQTVLETIYLIFNEGYSASSGKEPIRFELCAESIRLAQLITDYPGSFSKGSVHALISLMFLNASRFMARRGDHGELLTMEEQDRSLWDHELKKQGLAYLELATKTGELNTYLLLATISAQHCFAPDFASTDWKSILYLYDQLIQIDPSPLVLLSRAIVLARVHGPQPGLQVLEQLENNPALLHYTPFYLARAELFLEANEAEKAKTCLKKALTLTNSEPEKEHIRRKLTVLEK
jgi:RNA polymerase sigma factor (sigma-70 family)